MAIGHQNGQFPFDIRDIVYFNARITVARYF